MGLKDNIKERSKLEMLKYVHVIKDDNLSTTNCKVNNINWGIKMEMRSEKRKNIVSVTESFKNQCTKTINR